MHGKYKTFSNKKNYSDAKRFCALNGGHLASFETEAEYNAYGTFPNHYWVGANDESKEGKKICGECIPKIQFFFSVTMYNTYICNKGGSIIY